MTRSLRNLRWQLLTFQLHLTFFSWMRSTRAAGSKHSSHVVANQKASGFSQSKHRRVFEFSWKLRKVLCFGTKKELIEKPPQDAAQKGGLEGKLKDRFMIKCVIFYHRNSISRLSVTKLKNKQWQHYQQIRELAVKGRSQDSNHVHNQT